MNSTNTSRTAHLLERMKKAVIYFVTSINPRCRRP
jgi:hypothetical protein